MRSPAARLEQQAKGQGAVFAIIVAAIIIAASGINAQSGNEVGVGGRGAPMAIQPDGNFEERLEFPYVVNIEGTKETTLELVEQASESLRLIDQPPTSFSRLRRRAEGDLPRILDVMRARAHYSATVDLDIDQSTSPITITFNIDAGQSYDIKTVIIELETPTEDDIKLPKGSNIGLIKDKRASSTKIITAEAFLLNRAKKQGFAKAQIGKRRVIVDHSDKTVDITLRLSPGRKVYFGETEITGNQEVETRFIRRLIDWKPGDLVTPDFIDGTELNLIESGLFNSVRVELNPTLDDQGRQPMSIIVSESKHRSIEAGIGYLTDEGIGGRVGWQHRNLLGTGEQLGFELKASKLGWSLSGRAREPDFLRRRQALVIGAQIEVEDTDAFYSQSIGASAGIERSVGEGMELAVGLAFTASKVEEDDDEEEDFGLLSLPASFSWDHSNNLLDPTRGGRLFLQNEPFVDVFGNDVAFNKSSIAYRRYFRLRKERPRLVLAARAKAGFIFGAERSNVPADERFYAGGGGSVRGFAYQTAGELDEDDDPVGGRSLVEFAGELRSKITDTIGTAIFVDSGYAYSSTVPDFEDPLRIGAGAGLRYFSPVGPIRFDVGFPLNSRDSDDAFQIYVSIGQAF